MDIKELIKQQERELKTIRTNVALLVLALVAGLTTILINS